MSGTPIKLVRQKRIGKTFYKQASVSPAPAITTPSLSSPVSSETITQPSNHNNDLDYLKNLTKSILYKNDEPNRRSHTLPSLTSSNELDIKLYALFSLLLNNFVFGWYSNSLNLQNRDEFTTELVFLYAHVCRNVQEHINSQDERDELVKTLIIDLPYIINKHLNSVYEAMIESNNNSDRDFEEIWINKYSDGLADDEAMLQYRHVLIKGLVKILFPIENTNSKISKEFITSLLDGLVLKNIIESFCDNFVIWEILGKISNRLQGSTVSNNTTTSTNNKKQEPKIDSIRGKKEAFKKSKVHKVLEFFIVEEKFQMKQSNWMTFQDFVPFFNLLNFVILLDARFPLFFSIFQIILQLLLKLKIVQKFINSSIKRLIFQDILNLNTTESIVDLLRNLMFPLDERFDMKPRYIPQNDEELEVLYDRNYKLIKSWLSSGNRSSKIFISDGDNVDEKIKFLMSTFQYRSINKVFIQRVIDLLIGRIFPELHSQSIID